MEVTQEETLAALRNVLAGNTSDAHIVVQQGQQEPHTQLRSQSREIEQTTQ